MTDLRDHPFSSESIAYESGAASKGDRAWENFVYECTRLLGHSLDGCDVAGMGYGEGEGYSLDEAFDVWEAGKSAHAYVAMVLSRERYQGRQ